MDINRLIIISRPIIICLLLTTCHAAASDDDNDGGGDDYGDSLFEFKFNFITHYWHSDYKANYGGSIETGNKTRNITTHKIRNTENYIRSDIR